MFLTQKTFYFFTNYHLVFFRSTWLVAHGRRNAYQQKFWRSFNCFLNVTMVTFHIWFISMKVEQEKKYLVHLSLLRELMTSCVCVCVCVYVHPPWRLHLSGVGSPGYRSTMLCWRRYFPLPSSFIDTSVWITKPF